MGAMITLSSSRTQLIFYLIVLLLSPFPNSSADPDPLQDFCVADLKSSTSANGFPCKLSSEVTSDDFFFDGLVKEGNTSNAFGGVSLRGVLRFRVLVGFVSTANVFYSRVLRGGEMFVVPKGLVHFQMNVGEGKALIFTAFNSELPGAVVLPLTLFGSKPSVPIDVLTKAFQVDEDVVNGIKSKFGF
ncbi:hypothetical protein C3L33_00771, partial [Rhododendron williamsianum]